MPISITPSYVPSLLVQVQSPANTIQAVDGPPPCPANISEADWDDLLDALNRGLTMEIWSEAIACGFSKTPMGQSMGWLCHDILIERFSLAHLLPDDHLRLSQLLEVLWAERAEDPCFPLAEELEHEPPDKWDSIRYENRTLLNSLHTNPLAALIQSISDLRIGKRWSHMAITTQLIRKLKEQLPLIAVKLNQVSDPFENKITRLLCHLNGITRAKTTRQSWETHLSEPVYQQIKMHLWKHMKCLNRDRPEADVFEIIKTWDEIDAAKAAFNSPPSYDLLSRLCTFAETADYY